MDFLTANSGFVVQNDGNVSTENNEGNLYVKNPFYYL